METASVEDGVVSADFVMEEDGDTGFTYLSVARRREASPDRGDDAA
jgi:hypothetical protein